MSPSRLDAGVPGVLTDDEVAARLEGRPAPVRVNPPHLAPRPSPEVAIPPTLETSEELIAAEAAARAVLDELLKRRIGVASRVETLERQLEEGRAASLDPSTTKAVRSELRDLSDELAELDVLVERKSADHDLTIVARTAGFERDQAAEARARLEEVRARLPERYAAIDAAVVALLDAEDAFAELAVDASREVASLNALPEPYWVGPVAHVDHNRRPSGSWTPAEFTFDRSQIPSLAASSTRRRRYTLGL